MEENAVVSRQKTANSGRLSVIAAITMLPVMTHGCLNAYLTVVLPKFQQFNWTGIVLDYLQVSWIGRFRKEFHSIFLLFRFLLLTTDSLQWVWTNLPGCLVWWWLDWSRSGWEGKKALLVCSLLQILTTIAVPFWTPCIILLVALNLRRI